MSTSNSNIIKVLIIEDEPFARNELKRLLNNSSFNTSIVEYLESVSDAIEWFKENPQPELIFLDIQLSDGLSFQIFEKVTINVPVIFTTAYDEYAIRAFKLNSIDYLLKPIEPDALEKALSKFFKVKDLYSKKAGNINEEQILKLLELSRTKEDYKSRFLVKVGDQIKYINIEDVAYFFAEDNVVFLVTNGSNRYIIDHSLNQLSDLLNPKVFFRLNRSYYTNIKGIGKIHKFFNSRLKVELTPATDDEVIVSRVKVNDFLLWIES